MTVSVPKKILVLEISSHRAFPDSSAMLIASAGAELLRVNSTARAAELLKSIPTDQLIAAICNSPELEFFTLVRSSHPKAETVLLTTQTIHDYSTSLEHRDLTLLDHVIAHLNDEWTIDELRVTLQKIICKDLFGIEKYLKIGTPVIGRLISTSKDRDTCNSEVQRWVESCGLSKNIARLAFGITEELLMNAIYDAPVAGGRVHYESLERTTHRDLSPDEHSELRYGCDSKRLAISIQDPFGAFGREKWWQYTRKILKRDDSEGLMDTKKGGAGLGIFKMLYSSHAVICNVAPNKMTEVIVIIDISQPVRDFSIMPRSIHYFKS